MGHFQTHFTKEVAMHKMTTDNRVEIRLLCQNEIAEIAGGVISEGSHGVPTHTPGRLDPDASEQGTVAGAGL